MQFPIIGEFVDIKRLSFRVLLVFYYAKVSIQHLGICSVDRFCLVVLKTTQDFICNYHIM